MTKMNPTTAQDATVIGQVKCSTALIVKFVLRNLIIIVVFLVNVLVDIRLLLFMGFFLLCFWVF
jgi:hypothetical protein